MGYPAIVFLISAAFGIVVARQYRERRRPNQLAWVCALASAAAGSLSYVVFLAADKAELAFRLYYIFGALLTAPLLGLGSVLLIARGARRQDYARWLALVVLLGCAVDALLLLTSPVDGMAMRRLDGGPGTGVYPPGPWEPLLIVLNIVGAVCVVGVAAYSAWQVYRHAGSRRLLAANALIAAGTYVISQAGGQARSGLGASAFWLVMTLGWIVLFGGFLCTFNYRAEPRPIALASGRRRAEA
jgi:hypothetical protein